VFTGIDVLLAVRPLTVLFSQVPCDVRLSQAASGVTSSFNALLKLFERLGDFFQRLEIYISVQPTTKMTNIIVRIIIQVLSVLALATKEINAGPIGGQISKCTITYTLHMAQCYIERFGKKMFGDSEIEAALDKIDQLTQEEARMAGALTFRIVDGLAARENMNGTQCYMIYCR
jgi:hypothetical protein